MVILSRMAAPGLTGSVRKTCVYLIVHMSSFSSNAKKIEIIATKFIRN